MTAATPETRGNREQEVSLISRTLKAIAKELNVPIIALSQLSRNVENRGGSKRPQLSDLRESGAIEQDADVVAFIHRPEYYGLTTDENNMPTAGMAEIIIAKHRNGEVTDVPLRFIKEQAKFADADSSVTSTVVSQAPNYSREESYDDFSSSSNNFPPMGMSPMGMSGGIPNEFDLGTPSMGMPKSSDDAPF
jgi:replicative DNA helicase